MSTCIEKLECTDCGSSDSRQVFYNELEDNFSSFCFGECYETKGNPYKDGEGPTVEVKTDAQIAAEVKEVKKCTAFRGKGKTGKFRHIPTEYFQGWNLRQILSERDGVTPFAVGFPYTDDGTLTGWKIIPMDFKGFWSVGSTKGSDPFGMERALKIGGPKLYITEGEWDAIALNYALVVANKNSKFGKKGYAVISLPSGGGSIAKALKSIRKRIRKKFKEVILVMDNDEVGLKAEKTGQSLLPDILVSDKPHGCKDANDAIKTKEGLYEMAKMAQWNAHKPPIDGVVMVSDILDRALEKTTFGLSYPFEKLTEQTLGQKFGETVCLGAGVGVGKTVVAHKFAAHNIAVHDVPCFAVLLEEANAKTVKNICAKIDSIPYNNPKIKYDEEQFRETAMGLDKKLILWESHGDQQLRFDMDEILTAIRFNALEYGVKFVYLDNFTRLVDHLPTSDANEFINRYSSEVENLSAQLNLHIMAFSHLNPPYKGMPSHEEGGEVFANQFTGSRGIMRSFPMLMSFRRNKHADEDAGKSKNNSILSVMKHRNHDDGEGEVRTQYDPKTGQIIEYDWEGDLINDDKLPKRR